LVIGLLSFLKEISYGRFTPLLEGDRPQIKLLIGLIPYSKESLLFGSTAYFNLLFFSSLPNEPFIANFDGFALQRLDN
jgi:hypothetical protein